MIKPGIPSRNPEPSGAKINYESYIRDVAHITPPSQGESNIGYWMAQAARNGYGDFLTVISADDNINEGNDLTLNPYYTFDKQHLLTLPTGGHTGFREAKSTNPLCRDAWVECLMDLIYR